MAEVVLRHPMCDCGREEQEITAEICALASALRMSALINAEMMSMCSRNVVQALLLTAQSIQYASDHHVSHEEDDREINEGLARVREMRPLMEAIAQTPPKTHQH